MNGSEDFTRKLSGAIDFIVYWVSVCFAFTFGILLGIIIGMWIFRPDLFWAYPWENVLH